MSLEVGVLELQQREVELLDHRLELADQLLQARGAQLVQVADGGRQDHRASDRGRRLGLDVDLDGVLLEEHLVARLELAL